MTGTISGSCISDGGVSLLPEGVQHVKINKIDNLDSWLYCNWIIYPRVSWL